MNKINVGDEVASRGTNLSARSSININDITFKPLSLNDIKGKDVDNTPRAEIILNKLKSDPFILLGHSKPVIINTKLIYLVDYISSGKLSKKCLYKETKTIKTLTTTDLENNFIYFPNSDILYPYDFYKDADLGGGNKINATEKTDLTETLQAYYCAYFTKYDPYQYSDVKNNLKKEKNYILSKTHIGFNTLKYSSKKENELFDIVIDKMNAESNINWHKSSYNIAKKLKFKGIIKTGSEIYKKIGIVETIYNEKNKCISMNDDKWNPADIWICNDITLNIKNELNKNENNNIRNEDLNIDVLNNNIKRLAQNENKSLVGISLKKASMAANYQEINNNSAKPKYKFISAQREGDYTSSKFNTKFWSTKGGFIFMDEYKLNDRGEWKKYTRNIKVDIRAPNKYQTISFEITGGEARGGRGGGNYSTAFPKILGIEWILNKSYLDYTDIIFTHIEDLDINTLKQNIYVTNMYTQQCKINNIINTPTYFEMFIQDLLISKRDYIHANLATTDIIFKIMSSKSTLRDKFLTDMTRYAMSQSDNSSYHIKLS